MHIERLLSSLNRHDLAGVLACYHDDATFDGIAFHLEGKEQIGSMWRMVTSGDLRVTCNDVSADDHQGHAAAIDDYTFREAGRSVRNAIT